MAVYFGAREIETVVLDFDGTLYPPELQEEIYAPIRRQLVCWLLGDEAIASPVCVERFQACLDIYEVSARAIGWWPAFQQCGGLWEVYNALVLNAEKAPYLQTDSALGGLLARLHEHVHVIVF